MKKIIACISLVFAMSAGVTALAANEYVEEGNKFSLESNDNAYTTVLIQKGADTVYVNQDDSAFAAGTNFLLKGTELEDGIYTVKMGGSKTSAAMSETTFEITSFVPVAAPMSVTNKELAEDGTSYNYGFFGTVTAADCDYIAITVSNGTVTKTAFYNSPFEASGEGDVNAAVKVTGVPNDWDISVALTNANEE